MLFLAKLTTGKSSVITRVELIAEPRDGTLEPPHRHHGLILTDCLERPADEKRLKVQ
jgi:hypothetical protein